MVDDDHIDEYFFRLETESALLSDCREEGRAAAVIGNRRLEVTKR